MSSPSTVRRFGTAKTYGRTRESAATRAFDDVVSGKTPPIKAATKWGKTNFVAVRDDQKGKLEVAPPVEEKPKIDEDPFSFDTEDHRKSSPVKPQRIVVAAEAPRSVTKLPASRIVTQVKPSQAVQPIVHDESSTESSSSLPAAIARPGKTYTRAAEGRVSTGGRQQLIMDQFMEVGKTVRTEAGIEVVYTTRPQSPRAAWQMPAGENTSTPLPAVRKEDVSPLPKLPPAVSPAKEEVKPKPSYNADIDLDDDDDIFPATFRREPLKTYSGEIITPTNAPDSPPRIKKRKKPTGAPRGRRGSRYTDPSLIEEYRKRYQEAHAHLPDQTAGMNNSTVVSKKEVKGTQGTTLVVVCKPKVEVPDKKDDVQTKYFKNVKKELDKADKNISESDSQSESKQETSDSDVSPVKAPATRSSLASSQGSGSTASTPTRNLRVRFADQTDSSPTPSSAGSSVAPSPAKRPRPGAIPLTSSLRSKGKAPSSSHSSSPSSVASSPASSAASTPASSSTPGSGSVAGSSDSTNGVSTRSRSSGRQYRIFKSRGPPTVPPANEEAKEKEMEAADSPQMPELTPELPTLSDSGHTTDNPPNITDEEEEMDMTEASSQQTATVETSTPSTDSQVSNVIITVSETVSDSQKSDTSVDTQSPSEQAKSSGMRDTASRDTPSPSEMSDDSQELSQENSQKDEGPAAPAAPRRFFKSKKASSASNLQRKVFEKSPSKASYNARSWQQDQGEKESEPAPKPTTQTKKPVSSAESSQESTTDLPKLTRKVHWPSQQHEEAYTSVRVNKQHKELFTVVHNVKQAHEVQESGETQDFMDDVDYLLDSLRDDKPSSIRALSTIQLAGRCIMPAFRMHLRAHGTVTTIFSLLHDACSDPSLALSTAAMMFMLSRDRLNMDLDKESLHLMLKLNEVDMPRSNGQEEEQAATAPSIEEEDSIELEKCRQRVKDLLVQLQRETNAKQIDLGFVSTGNLAMESLLSLTSRRAGEWFKEELRQLGGLDHFVESIHHCVSEIKEDLVTNFANYLPSLKKLDRCLRVLENITFMNSDNQSYLIAYNRGLLISSTSRVLKMCVDCLPTHPPSEFGEEYAKDQVGWTVFNSLLCILRVLLNITHDSEFGSTRVGEEEGLMQAILTCVVNTQWFVPAEQRFDLLVLSLGLLVNLMEHCVVNRRYLVEAKVEAKVEARFKEEDQPAKMDAVEALVQLFLQRETAARQMEEAPDTPSKGECESPNKSGEWRESDSGIEWIAKSAEKVKAAEKEQRNAKEKEGGATPSSSFSGANESTDSEKPIDGASILEDEETFTKALHKAGKHMENSIVASYVGLLLGCLIQDNRKYVESVRQHLPDGSFDPMIKILKKFLSFMSLTTAVGTTDANSIQHVIETLEAC